MIFWNTERRATFLLFSKEDYCSFSGICAILAVLRFRRCTKRVVLLWTASVLLIDFNVLPTVQGHCQMEGTQALSFTATQLSVLGVSVSNIAAVSTWVSVSAPIPLSVTWMSVLATMPLSIPGCQCQKQCRCQYLGVSVSSNVALSIRVSVSATLSLSVPGCQCQKHCRCQYRVSVLATLSLSVPGCQYQQHCRCQYLCVIVSNNVTVSTRVSLLATMPLSVLGCQCQQ